MPTVMMRTYQKTQSILKEIAAEKNMKIIELLELIVEAERRRTILEESDKGFANLKKDKQAWKEEQLERMLWDTTLLD